MGLLIGCSDFLESRRSCEVAMQPEETPVKTTNLSFYTLISVRIKQTRHNILINELKVKVGGMF